MSVQIFKLKNTVQMGLDSNGISFDDFLSKFSLKNQAHSCGDVKCGGSTPIGK